MPFNRFCIGNWPADLVKQPRQLLGTTVLIMVWRFIPVSRLVSVLPWSLANV